MHGEPSAGAARDFFISYVRTDAAWAQWVAWELESYGYSVLIQKWDLVPGTNWIDAMHRAVQAPTRTIAPLSPDYLRSAFATAEWQAVWADDQNAGRRRLLVARVADFERPGLLSGVVSVDLFGRGESEAASRLRDMVDDTFRRRAKPADRPPFPDDSGADRPRFPAPRVWNVPPRNQHFTGRRESLSRLWAGLVERSSITVFSMRGMAGIGKTQLAVEHCHSRATDYEVVWWVNAEQVERLQDQFASLAEALRLDVPAGTRPEELVARVHDALREVSGWLIVFDNAEQLSDIRPFLPGGVVRPDSFAHVIVTTRHRGFHAIGAVLEIDVLDRAESVELLRRLTSKQAPELSTDVADEMAQWLGDLPLALEQAGGYIEDTGLAPAEYIGLLRTHEREMHARGQATYHEETIATLWDVALSRLEKANPAAVQLLGVCAYLAAEPIPVELFSRHADLLPEPLAGAAAKQMEFVETIGALVKLALAGRTPAGLVVHRLVQAVVRDRDGARTGDERVSGDAASSTWLTVALRLLRANLPAKIFGHPEHWPLWQSHLSHVLAVTGHETPHRAAGSAAWLLSRAATYLMLVQGRPSDALSLFERALEIDEAGPDQAAVAIDLNDVAMVLQDLGDPGSARPLVERALAIDEALQGPEHIDVAIDLNNLAVVVQDLGDVQAARPLLERALAINRAFHGPESEEVAIDLNNLAMILQDLGDVEAAIPLLRRSRDIFVKTHGPQHIHVASELNNLGTALIRVGPGRGGETTHRGGRGDLRGLPRHGAHRGRHQPGKPRTGAAGAGRSRGGGARAGSRDVDPRVGLRTRPPGGRGPAEQLGSGGDGPRRSRPGACAARTGAGDRRTRQGPGTPQCRVDPDQPRRGPAPSRARGGCRDRVHACARDRRERARGDTSRREGHSAAPLRAEFAVSAPESPNVRWLICYRGTVRRSSA